MKFVKNVIILNMTRNTQIKTIIFLGKDHPESIFLGKERNMKSEKVKVAVEFEWIKEALTKCKGFMYR